MLKTSRAGRDVDFFLLKHDFHLDFLGPARDIAFLSENRTSSCSTLVFSLIVPGRLGR